MSTAIDHWNSLLAEVDQPQGLGDRAHVGHVERRQRVADLAFAGALEDEGLDLTIREPSSSSEFPT